MTDESSPDDLVASYKIGDKETFIHAGELHINYTFPDYPINKAPFKAALTASKRYRKKVLILSSQQSVDEVALELMIHSANLDTATIENNKNKRDRQKLMASVGKLLSTQISIDHMSNMSMDDIDAKCRDVIEKDELDIVIINSIKDDGTDDFLERICIELGPLCYKFGVTVFICMKNLPTVQECHPIDSQDSHLRRLNIHPVL